GVVAGHGGADCAPGDAVSGLVQAHQRRLQAVGFGQQVGGGDVYVLQRESGGDGGAERPLAVNVLGFEAGAVGFYQEAADFAVVLVAFGPDYGNIGDGAGGDPHLLAVE